MTSPSQVETLAAQVRRCARCGAPAAILVRVHTAGGGRWEPGDGAPPRTCRGATFRCQSCGAVLEHALVGARDVALAALLALGVLLMGFGTLLFGAMTIAGHPDGGLEQLACVAPAFAVQLALLVAILRRSLSARRWPIVDAPRRPELTRRAPEPPARRCRCGAPAPVVAVVRERVRGLPVGRVHEHTCSACRRTFVVHGVGAIAFAVLASSLLTAAGALCLLHPPGSSGELWPGAVLALIGAGSWALPVARIVGRLRHPEVRPTVF